MISPGLIFVQMAFLLGLFLRELIFGGLIIGGNFTFQNGLDLTIKTASINSPWACIQEGLLSKGYLSLRIRGLIFGRAYFWGGLIIGILLYFNYKFSLNPKHCGFSNACYGSCLSFHPPFTLSWMFTEMWGT